MFSMRTLLAIDPFLSAETREAIGLGHETARDQLLLLGLSQCEAAELLDEVRSDCRGFHVTPCQPTRD